MAGKSVKSLQAIQQDKHNLLMETVAWRAAYYRENVECFVADYLNVHLKTFQKILLHLMMYCTNFMYVASRGQGKTYLVALYAVCRCILYPGTKVVVASGTKNQAIETIDKIDKDFMREHDWGSTNLRNEISFISTGINNAVVLFKNGSWIKCVTSNDNARSNRANVLIADEFRLIDLTIINTVLRRFLTSPRQPGYLQKSEYAHLAERNIEMYMSSSWFRSHWSFRKLQSYFVNMLDDTKKIFLLRVTLSDSD